MSPIVPVRVDPDVQPYVVKTGIPMPADHPLAADDCPVCGEVLHPGPVALVFVGREPDTGMSRWTGAAVTVHARCTGTPPAPDVTDDQIGAYWDTNVAPGLTGVPADEVARQRAQYIADVRANPRALAELAAQLAADPTGLARPAYTEGARRLAPKLVAEGDFDGLAALIGLLVNQDDVTTAGTILRDMMFSAVISGAQSAATPVADLPNLRQE